MLVAATLCASPAHAQVPLGGAPGLPSAQRGLPIGADAAVCRPTLIVDGRPRRTGTAFLLQVAGGAAPAYLLTAQHLFGMRGPQEIPWREMPVRATSASCRTLRKDWSWKAGPAVAIEGAHAMGPLPSLTDIAVLPVIAARSEAARARSTALALAPEPPRPGDTVWLVAELAGSDHTGEHLFAATVLPSSGFLAFAYAAKGLNLSNTSGAPIIDADGEAVGVNVAVAFRGDEIIGFADDLATMNAALAQERRR